MQRRSTTTTTTATRPSLAVESSNGGSLIFSNSLTTTGTTVTSNSSVAAVNSNSHSPLIAQPYKKVVVPEVTTPVISWEDLGTIGGNWTQILPQRPINNQNLQNQASSTHDLADRSISCPDGNVLRKVASITAGSLGIRAINFSNEANFINNNENNKTERIEFRSLLAGTKFDLKQVEKFEGIYNLFIWKIFIP